jgi:HAD superfamily hydrolase (TIGR01509 family)
MEATLQPCAPFPLKCTIALQTTIAGAHFRGFFSNLQSTIKFRQLGRGLNHLLRAVIFDFDGVIVDSEPLIFRLTQEMAAREGWSVGENEYYQDYLALDDRGIVEHLYASHGRPVDVARRDELVAWKAQKYEEIIRDGLPAMPGAVEFVTEMARLHPLAIASGSLHAEIQHLLTKLDLREKFQVLATADDCQRSKPDPEVYLTALLRLRALPGFRDQPLQAEECLAIEDAPLGVVAAQAAGLKCLALAHSRPPAELQYANWVASEFSNVDMQKIRAAFN